MGAVAEAGNGEIGCLWLDEILAFNDIKALVRKNIK